jgi:hypothetical protein
MLAPEKASTGAQMAKSDLSFGLSRRAALIYASLALPTLIFGSTPFTSCFNWQFDARHILVDLVYVSGLAFLVWVFGVLRDGVEAPEQQEPEPTLKMLRTALWIVPSGGLIAAGMGFWKGLDAAYFTFWTILLLGFGVVRKEVVTVGIGVFAAGTAIVVSNLPGTDRLALFQTCVGGAMLLVIIPVVWRSIVSNRLRRRRFH